MGSMLTEQSLRTFAFAGQYLTPFACLFGVIGSVFASAHREKLVGEGVRSLYLRQT